MSPASKFKDGIYLNFEQVRNNDPIPKAKILTSADYNDKEFFKDLLASDKIYFTTISELGRRLTRAISGDIQETESYTFRYRAISTGSHLWAA